MHSSLRQSQRGAIKEHRSGKAGQRLSARQANQVWQQGIAEARHRKGKGRSPSRGRSRSPRRSRSRSRSPVIPKRVVMRSLGKSTLLKRRMARAFGKAKGGP